jgi:hypothetical protein
MNVSGLTKRLPQPAFDAMEPRLLLSDTLITFPTWNQDGPISGSSVQWNQYCPLDPYTLTRSETGCTATADAQVLYYWKFPPSVSFSTANDSYVSNGDGGPIQIDGDAGKAQFLTFAQLNSRLSSIQYDGSADEEALLSFAVGIKVNEDYAADGSGAAVINTTFAKFGYESADESSDWASIKPTVISNIKSGQPVVLGIWSADGQDGHSVVLDGYNSGNDTFHVNLGWGADGDNENGNNDWYNLPTIYAEGTSYTTISTIDYNIEPVLPPPTGVTASQGTYPDHVHLTWQAAPEATGYEVWRSATNDPSTAVAVSSDSLTGTSYDTSVVFGSPAYYYWVQSRSQIGGSALANPALGYIGGAYVDLTGRFDNPWTLPSSIVGGQPLVANTAVMVINRGNVALPPGQMINILVVAHDTVNGANPDITLATLNGLSVSGLGAGDGSVTFCPKVNLPDGLSAGHYQIFADITPVQALTELRTDNNQVSQTSFGTTVMLAVAAPVVDLSAQFGGAMTLPYGDISGDGALISVPVVVRNAGNVAMTAGQKIDIQIDMVSNGLTTPLRTLSGQSVSSLKPNALTTFTTSVTLPPGMASGAYNLVATVDSSHQLADSNETNNTVISPRTIAVTYGYVDLSGVFGTAWTVPPSVVANTTKLTGSLSVVVTNNGNVSLPTGQQVNIVVEARDTTNPANSPIPLATLTNKSVSKLGPKQSLTFSPAVAAGTLLPADTYQIWADIVPVQTLTESDPNNNWVSATAAPSSAAKTILAAPAFVDLQAGFGATVLPTSPQSGDGKAITVPVMVTNIGNVPLASGLKINIDINAVGAGLTTTLLKTLIGLSVGSLGNGKSATFTTTVTLPPGMSPGAYSLQVVEDTTGVVTDDTHLANNTFTSLAKTNVSEGHVDLSGMFGSAWTVPPSVVAATTKLTGAMSVVMTNNGNVPLPAGQQVNIVVEARDTTNPANSPITLATLTNKSVSKLGPKQSLTFSPAVIAGTFLPADNFQIWADIVPVQTLTESDMTNNWVSATAAPASAIKTILAAPAFVDLQAGFGSALAWGGGRTSGDGKAITVPVVVTNIGNVPLKPGLKINIDINAIGAGLTTTLLKTLTGQSVGSLANGKSATFTTTVTLRPGMPSGAYNLQAVVDTTDVVTDDTNLADNTFATLGTMQVIAGFVDLPGTFGTSKLPLAIAAGQALTGSVSVTLKNTGKVALPAGQLADIQLVAVTDHSATPLTPLTGMSVSVSALAANGTKAFSIPVSATGGLAAGVYQIEAVITPTNNLTEFGSATYTVLQNSLTHTLNITVS